jgi:hypothetical protein
MRWITVNKDDGWFVVHGSAISGQLNRRTDHAWCERRDVVVDLTMPLGSRQIPRDRYYEAFKPESMMTYSADEALFLSVKAGHHGPWSDLDRRGICD